MLRERHCDCPAWVGSARGTQLLCGRIHSLVGLTKFSKLLQETKVVNMFDMGAGNAYRTSVPVGDPSSLELD